MTSQNNSTRSQQGSALIVTILLVSVLLVTALILLQRIIPYAKSVRSMHDASQAYYVARGEVDMARLEFFYGGDTPVMVMRIPTLFGFLSSPDTAESSVAPTPSTQRGNIFTAISGVKQLQTIGNNEGEKKTELKLPFSLGAAKTSERDHVVVSATPELPLKVKLFPTDTTIKNFGTSKVNSLYHTLYSRNSGGLRFDLRGVKTDDMTTLKLKFPSQTFTGTLTVKMQYFDADNAINTDVKTFTNEEFHNAVSDVNLLNRTGNTQIIKSDGGVQNPVLSNPSFEYFLDNNCAGATICSLTLTLNSTTNQSIDFQLISDKQIPDLNAVIVGDGLSGNGLYYQRIIDLIPTPQDI